MLRHFGDRLPHTLDHAGDAALYWLRQHGTAYCGGIAVGTLHAPAEAGLQLVVRHGVELREFDGNAVAVGVGGANAAADVDGAQS